MAKSFISFAIDFIQRFKEHDITGSAAKATYYLLLSFSPLCLLLISFFKDTAVLAFFLPESIAVLLQDISAPELAFQTTSILVILWSASASIWALMTGINTAYTGRRKINLIRGRLRAIALIFLLGIAFIPDLKLKVKSISFGAMLTAIGWVVASWGFEVYMRMFNNYSILYGSISVFLGLALWLFVITIVLLSGAEINVMMAEIALKLEEGDVDC